MRTGSILVVEDVPNVLELIEVTLRFKGYKVITARNGVEGLEQARSKKPAMIITDILMPKLDGYAFVHELRKDPAISNIPVVFLSATYLTPEDRAFGLSLGAVRFLEKPIDTEEFLLTIAEIMTSDPATMPPALNSKTFFTGYKERLEHKLRHKSTQIARFERLIPTLPNDQKEAFSGMMEQAKLDKTNIQSELRVVYRALDEIKAAE